MKTGLTPAMERMALLRKESESEGSSAGVEELRHMVIDAIDKNIFGTAAFLSECLLRLPGANDADGVLFARCYYLQGQPRRCLAALENKGLLSATNISRLVDFLDSPDGLESLRLRGEPAAVNNFMAVLSAIQLAANCLLALEQLEDCLALLESVVTVDTSAAADGILRDSEAKSLRVKAQKLREAFKILALDSTPANTNTTSTPPSTLASATALKSFEINPLSGIYCTLGKCMDLLENRPLAIRAFLTAAAVDVACTEAVDYVTSNSMLSVDERARLYRFLRGQQLSEDRAWLDGFYRYALLGDDSDGVPFQHQQQQQQRQQRDGDDAGNHTTNSVNNSVFAPRDSTAPRRSTDLTTGGGGADDLCGSNSVVFKSLSRGFSDSVIGGGELSFSAMSTSSTIPLTPSMANASRASPGSAGGVGRHTGGLLQGSDRSSSLPLSNYVPSTSESLSRAAERKFDNLCCEDAYRLARQAYTVDPFDHRGLHIYIASMTELGLKTELFYLGHELTSSHPKSAVSWYAVGCYYFCCARFELSQKFLLKATKLDKRYAKAWVALGHSLSAQEESEHAIAAFRTASRLLPGDHRPILYMAKELVRTSYFSLALHLLSGALKMAPNDPTVLNELGVAFLKVDRLDDALKTFVRAVDVLDTQSQSQSQSQQSTSSSSSSSSSSPSSSSSSSSSSSPSSSTNSRLSKLAAEIYNNLATVLRKSDRLPESLEMFNRCLALNPSDAATHAHIAYTLHLMKDFDKAISAYHRSLALNPLCTFCADMLGRAMVDATQYSESTPVQSSSKSSSNTWVADENTFTGNGNSYGGGRGEEGMYQFDDTSPSDGNSNNNGSGGGGSCFLPEVGLEFLTEAWQ